MPPISIIEADLAEPAHERAVVSLVDAYAMDPMGNGRPLPEDIRRNLGRGLRDHPTTLVFLAYDGEDPVGVAVCFLGFSTFAARPLVNIHDLAVLPEYRGKGVGRALLAAVEEKARSLGCCKLTLEVFENNHRARRTYEAAGFKHAMYNDDAGGALFLAKSLQVSADHVYR